MGSGLPGSLPSYILYYLLLYISSLAYKIVVVSVHSYRVNLNAVHCDYNGIS